ncbi:MAG: S16 family serine protease [Candidatus Hydrothermarchaeales archaeon]
MLENNPQTPTILQALAILVVFLGVMNVYQYREIKSFPEELKQNEAEINTLSDFPDKLQDELSYANSRLSELDETIGRLSSELDLRSKELQEAEKEIERLGRESDETKSLSRELNASLFEAEEEISKLSFVDKRETYTLGVWRGGIAIPIEIETRFGSGLLIDTDDVLWDETVQRSLKIAYYVASIQGRGGGLDGKEFTLRIRNPLEDTITINGESAGAAITIAMIALALDQELNSSVLITGSIGSDGSIGEVKSIWNKAQAAKSVNATVLLVPEGKGIQVEGIEILEVANITQVMSYMLQ